MTTLLTKNHAMLTAEVQKHITADAVIQGEYWDGSQGCFIGCLAHSSDATILPDRFGLPLPLVRICENVFGGLPLGAARAFFAAIPAAVGRNGKDLSRVQWAFLDAQLRTLPVVPAEIQAVIDPVIAGMDLLAAGREWPKDAADAAADAAYAAADAVAAVDAVAYAAYAAAYAAYAADAADVADHAAHAAFAAAYAAYAAACGPGVGVMQTAADAARLRQRDTLLALIAAA